MIRWLPYLLLFSFAFGCRVFYIFSLAPVNHLDPGEMERAANCLATKGYLGDVYPTCEGPSAHVAPLYAFFLGGIYSLFGYDNSTSRLIQKLCAGFITSLAITLLPALGQKLKLDLRSGWLAGWIVAVQPFYWFDETSGSWEQPYSALFLVGIIWCLVALVDCSWESTQATILLAIVLGLSTLLNPILGFIGGFLLLVELIRQKESRKRILRRSILTISIAFLVVLPWIIRNYWVLHEWITIRSNFGLELRIGNNDLANGKTSITYGSDPNTPFLHLHPFVNQREQELYRQLGESAYMRLKQHQAFVWIGQHPTRFFELTLNRIGLYWFPPERMWEPDVPFRSLRPWIYLLIGIGCLIGIVSLIYRKHPATNWIVVILISGSCIYYVTHVDVRYRYPLWGFSILIASEGALWLWDGIKRTYFRMQANG